MELERSQKRHVKERLLDTLGNRMLHSGAAVDAELRGTDRLDASGSTQRANEGGERTTGPCENCVAKHNFVDME